jgi:hypothetical protein
MAGENTSVYLEQGGSALVLIPGGKIKIGGTAILTTDADGNVILTGLPSSDPAVVGALYTATGAVKVSAGP